MKSLTSEATPLATQFYKRSYKISHNPGLLTSWDALPSFAREWSHKTPLHGLMCYMSRPTQV